MGHKVYTPPYAVLALVVGSVAALTLVGASGSALGSPRVSPTTAALQDALAALRPGQRVGMSVVTTAGRRVTLTLRELPMGRW